MKETHLEANNSGTPNPNRGVCLCETDGGEETVILPESAKDTLSSETCTPGYINKHFSTKLIHTKKNVFLNLFSAKAKAAEFAKCKWNPILNQALPSTWESGKHKAGVDIRPKRTEALTRLGVGGDGNDRATLLSNILKHIKNGSIKLNPHDDRDIVLTNTEEQWGDILGFDQGVIEEIIALA